MSFFFSLYLTLIQTVLPKKNNNVQKNARKYDSWSREKQSTETDWEVAQKLEISGSEVKITMKKMLKDLQEKVAIRMSRWGIWHFIPPIELYLNLI